MTPYIDLERHRQCITQWVAEGVTQDNVRLRLEHEHGIKIGRTTLVRALAKWRVRAPEKDDALIRDRIEYMFFELRLSDAQTVAMLKDEHINISPRRVQMLRIEMGLLKKVSVENHDADNSRITELLRQEYLIGSITDFGKGRLYQHMRATHGIVGRNRVYEAARRLMPETFERRRRRDNRVVMPAQAYGPNHMWSMDAHCKFSDFNITIYGAIDVYSRYIVWMHVGVAAKTSTSVLAQYLRCLAQGGVMPEVIRVDGGSETNQAGLAHLTLSNAIRTRPGEPPLEAEHVFRLGTSKQNQRIEQYWGQQSRGALNQWRQFFLELVAQDLFNKMRIADQIAFLAVYMPILRKVVSEFVVNHNRHNIRKQKNRPNAVQGIPELLYTHPRLSGAEHYGFAVPPSLLRPWQDQLQTFNMEEYLPPETLSWCNSSLRGGGFDVPLSGYERDPRTHERVHEAAYLQLRRSIERHMDMVNEPRLEMPYVPLSEDWKDVLETAAAEAAAAATSGLEHGSLDDMSFLPHD